MQKISRSIVDVDPAGWQAISDAASAPDAQRQRPAAPKQRRSALPGRVLGGGRRRCASRMVQRLRSAVIVKPVLRLSPLMLSLVLVCSAVGGLVLTGLVVLTVLPLLVGLGLLAVWVVVVLLLGWAGIEALAALERWMESSPRLRR